MKIIFSIFIGFLLCNCNECENAANIKIPDLIKKHYNQDNKYCELLSKAVINDSLAISEFSVLRLYDGSSYHHGEVLIQLIEYIGEDNYINAISGFSKDEKDIVQMYLRAGIDIHTEYKDKNLEDLFPKIYAFLNN